MSVVLGELSANWWKEGELEGSRRWRREPIAVRFAVTDVGSYDSVTEDQSSMSVRKLHAAAVWDDVTDSIACRCNMFTRVSEEN